MTFHHIIRQDEQKNTCTYCGNKDIVGCKSTFAGQKHYKELHFACGHKIKITVPFMGSGDDNWCPNLDKRVEEVDSESQKK